MKRKFFPVLGLLACAGSALSSPKADHNSNKLFLADTEKEK